MSTPRALRAFVAVIALLALGLGLFLTTAALEIGYGLRGIERDGGPSALAAAKAVTALSDMDRNLATTLLAHRNGDDELREAAEEAYAEARGTASLEIQMAGGGNGALIEALAEYEDLAGRARYLIADGPEGGKPSGPALAAFRKANEHFRSAVSPTALELAKDRQRAVGAGGPVGPVGWTLFLGALLASALIALQWFLDRRTHRMFNPALMISTFVVTLLVAGYAVVFGNAESLRKEASGEMLSGVLAVERARKLGYGLNADQIRKVADPGFGGQYDRDFLDKSQRLLHVGDASSAESYIVGLPPAEASVPGNRGVIPAVLRGSLTAPEYALEHRMYSAYQDYHANASKEGAVAGEAFAAYDQAVAELAEERRAAFFFDLRTAPGGLGVLTFLPAVVLVIALALGFAGVRPRLAEYR